MAGPERTTASLSRVLVSGASGLIGGALAPSLRAAGSQVTRLVRSEAKATDELRWDPAKEIEPQLVSGFDAVIHLSGESILGRWTREKKENIRKSRVDSTRNLAQALARAQNKPRILLVGSATGYYGDRGDEILCESSASGTGFLAEVCRAWEAASEAAEDAGIRVVHSRTGIVLSSSGGALGQMLTPFRLGVGGRIGSGEQWMSWIHINDMVRALEFVLQNEALRGAVNLVAPSPVRNTAFTQTLARVLTRPALLPVPAFALHLIFGKEMADETLLTSQRVEPGLLEKNGYPFRFAHLEPALRALLRQKSP